MTRKNVWFIVENEFLTYVQKELTSIYRKIQDSYVNTPPESSKIVMDAFTKTHIIGGSTTSFFKEYYRTNLISKHKTDSTKVLMFGFLRTIFLGILRGTPRTKVFAKRVHKYKITHKLAQSLEDLLILYRKRIGFHKRILPKEVYQKAGTQSECKDLPEHACLPPKCQYNRTRRNGKLVEYCSIHESRRRKTANLQNSLYNKTRRKHRK
jgi:hypothetical protein